MDSDAGQVFHSGHSTDGPTKTFKTAESRPTNYVTLIYNATTKYLSWKVNDDEWRNSIQVEPSAEYSHQVWFVVTSYGGSKYEVVSMDWTGGEQLPEKLRNSRSIRYLDSETLL